MPDNTTVVTVGDYVTDVSFLPFIRSQPIRFVATGLKPNSLLYAFFDRVAVSAYCQPGSIDSSNTFHSSGALGSQLQANSTGGCTGTFYVPGGTFFVGERVLTLMDVSSVNSTPTTTCSMTFNAYNFSVNKSTVTVTTTRPVETTNTTPANTQPPITTPPPPVVVTPPANVVISSSNVTPAAITWPTFSANVVQNQSNTQTYSLTLYANSSAVTGITQPIQVAFVVNGNTANVYCDGGKPELRGFILTSRVFNGNNVQQGTASRNYNIFSTEAGYGSPGSEEIQRYLGSAKTIDVGYTQDQTVYTSQIISDYSGKAIERSGPTVIPGDQTGYQNYTTAVNKTPSILSAYPAPRRSLLITGGFQGRNLFQTFDCWKSSDLRFANTTTCVRGPGGSNNDVVTVANGDHFSFTLQLNNPVPWIYGRMNANGYSLDANSRPIDGASATGNSTSHAAFTVNVINITDANASLGSFTVDVRLVANNFTGTL